MIGVIIGDIVGSRYERRNKKTKDFDFFGPRCKVTDDTVMSLAVCKALLQFDGDYVSLSKATIHTLQEVGQQYPRCGYGRRFKEWVKMEDPEPYNSYGNGAGMRVSGCAYVGNTLEEVKALSKSVTVISHDHPEGIKGAEAVAVAVFLARQGKTLEEIREHITKEYYPLDFTIDGIRSTYRFDSSCQGSVPQALQAFFESTDFEDAIRTAISVGGDSDTIAAMTGSVAEAYYGVPRDLREQALTYLDENLLGILEAFELKYPGKIEA